MYMTQNDQGTEDISSDDANDQDKDDEAGKGSDDNAGGDDSGQSGGADDKALTLEEVTELIRGDKGLESKINGLITGYTTSRADINKMTENLGKLTEAINKKSGAEEGDDDYVTKKDMSTIIKDALSANTDSASKQKESNEKIIDDALITLRAEGIISSDEDEKVLITHAVKIEQPDLRKAAKSLAEVKKAGAEAVKKAAQKQAKKDEGSGVGDSSGSTGSEQGGVDYAKLKKMQENDDFT